MTATHAISNHDDIIDSRDVIERLDELEADVDNLDEDELDELRALRQMAEDIGAISGDESWPLNYIDWAAAAEALQMDYTSIDFDGVEYWVPQGSQLVQLGEAFG